MFKYEIYNISEKSRWIFIKSDDEYNLDLEEPDAFVYFVKTIKSYLGGNIVPAGDTQYQISNDKYKYVFQWDDLFGIVVIYPDSLTSEEARTILSRYMTSAHLYRLAQ